MKKQKTSAGSDFLVFLSLMCALFLIVESSQELPLWLQIVVAICAISAFIWNILRWWLIDHKDRQPRVMFGLFTDPTPLQFDASGGQTIVAGIATARFINPQYMDQIPKFGEPNDHFKVYGVKIVAGARERDIIDIQIFNKHRKLPVAFSPAPPAVVEAGESTIFYIRNIDVSDDDIIRVKVQIRGRRRLLKSSKSNLHALTESFNKHHSLEAITGTKQHQ